MAREIARGEEAVHGLRRAYGEQGRWLVPIIEDSSVPQRVGSDTRRDLGGVAGEDASGGGGRFRGGGREWGLCAGLGHLCCLEGPK